MDKNEPYITLLGFLTMLFVGSLILITLAICVDQIFFC